MPPSRRHIITERKFGSQPKSRMLRPIARTTPRTLARTLPRTPLRTPSRNPRANRPPSGTRTPSRMRPQRRLTSRRRRRRSPRPPQSPNRRRRTPPAKPSPPTKRPLRRVRRLIPRLIPPLEHYFSIINPLMARRRLPSAAALLNTAQNKTSRADKRAETRKQTRRGTKMERIWLKQYPAGVPADIDVTQYSSLVELLEESFAKFSDRKAFICMDKSISYRDLDEMSLALAAYLQSLGLQKGARVALMMPNVLQYPVSTAAVLRAGYGGGDINPLYTPGGLEHQLKDAGAEAIIVLENFATTVQQVLGKTSLKHVIVGSMGDMLGLKGVIVNLVVRRVKKMVPAYSIPG